MNLKPNSDVGTYRPNIQLYFQLKRKKCLKRISADVIYALRDSLFGQSRAAMTTPRSPFGIDLNLQITTPAKASEPVQVVEKRKPRVPDFLKDAAPATDTEHALAKLAEHRRNKRGW